MMCAGHERAGSTGSILTFIVQVESSTVAVLLYLAFGGARVLQSGCGELRDTHASCAVSFFRLRRRFACLCG